MTKVPVTTSAPSVPYLANPWAFREVAHDFELLDAWQLPITNDTPDARTLFEVLARVLRAPHRSNSPAGMLFAVRRACANLFGWDREANSLPIPGCPDVSLRERCEGAGVEPFPADAEIGFFRVVYLTDTEFALEVSNQLLHAAMHVGWTATHGGGFAAQMGVWVKHRGACSRLYLAAITPGRRWFVYPALMRTLDRAWANRSRQRLSDGGE